MDDPKVPGVYVEEVDAPSFGIQSGETAVPVFVGYFSKQSDTPDGLVHVSSWLDFTRKFESQGEVIFTVELDKPSPAFVPDLNRIRSAVSIRLYFENGGGQCYVLPVSYPGGTGALPQPTLASMVTLITQCPDITLMCWCELHATNDATMYQELGKLLGSAGRHALFLLTDGVSTGEGKFSVPSAPDSIGKSQMAAYFPTLSISAAVAKPATPTDIALLNIPTSISTITTHYGFGEVKKALANAKTAADKAVVDAAADSLKLAAANKSVADVTNAQADLKKIEDAWSAFVPPATYPVPIRASVAMAGIYARVDRERGVWKAPANVEIVGALGLIQTTLKRGAYEWSTIRIDDALNGTLIDAGINAIREFKERGICVWGARTCADPMDEAWRYIPVRRLFNTIERDVSAALRAVTFEPNNARTWEAVRSAVESYLHTLWRQHGLVGASVEEAYFVHADLGVTMTDTDVSQGRMIVKVGIAAVRPAEFIVLQLTQQISPG